MAIRVQMPDGTIAEFPDGTSRDVIDRVAKQNAATLRQSQPKVPDVPRERTGIIPTIINRIPTIINQFGQGFTYGSADEAVARAEAAAGIMPYEQSLSSQAAERDAQSRRYPVTAAVSDLAGAILSPNPIGKLGAIRNAGRTVRAVTRAGSAGTVGGIEGALRANPNERAEGAVTGALFGTVAAPATEAFGGLLRGAWNLGKRAFRPDEARRANQELIASMRAAGLTDAQVAVKLAEAERLGVPMPFGQALGASGQQATERMALGGGQAADTVRSGSKGLLDGTKDRVDTYVRDATGPRENPGDITDAFKAARNKNAKQVYGEARGMGAVMDEDIANQIASDPWWQQMYKQAQIDARRKGDLPLPDIFDSKGNVTALPTVAAIDYLLRSGRAELSSKWRSGSPDASGLQALWDRLETRAKEAIPEYAQARKQYFDDSQLVRFAELGERLATMSASERERALRGLAPEAIQIVRRNARATLWDQMARMRDGGIPGALSSSENSRWLLNFISDSPAEAEKLAARLKGEMDLREYATKIDPNKGADTGRRLAAQGQGVDQLEKFETGSRFALGGNAERVAMLFNVFSGRLRGLTEGTRAEAAKMLMALDPDEQFQVLSRLSAEERKLAQEAVDRARRSQRDFAFGTRIPGLLNGED